MPSILFDKQTCDWDSKEISLTQLVQDRLIPNGSTIYIGSCAATPDTTLQAIIDDVRLENLTILRLIPSGNYPHIQHKNLDQLRTASFYSFTKGGFFKPDHTTTTTSKLSVVTEGLEDYKPVSIAAIPRLLKETKLQIDVALIKVTPPHKGFCSLGMGVDSTYDIVQYLANHTNGNKKGLIIAEINANMPWTEGPTKIPVSDITYWLRPTASGDVTMDGTPPNDEPLKLTQELWPAFITNQFYARKILDRIGENVVDLIPDQATLRFGISPIVHSVFPFLRQRKDLGLHTDILSQTLYQLHLEGIITNKYKTINTGRTVCSQAHAETYAMYDFLDRNPVIEFHPSSYVCNPQVLGRIDNLIVVVGALKVDVTGQVATDSIAHKFYGGVWSDDDSIRGAKFSNGGKPIVVLSSKSLQGRSNIVFALPPGTGVSITRADVEYVVTEYGTAYLYGKSIRERCLALIEIAHPDFRQELLQDCKQYNYVSQNQPGSSFKSLYPGEFQCTHMTKPKEGSPRQVLVRPIKAIDEDNLRNFFHQLSDHSVYLRYFRKLRSMPQRILQKTTDLDYTRDMAIVVRAHGRYLHP